MDRSCRNHKRQLEDNALQHDETVGYAVGELARESSRKAKHTKTNDPRFTCHYDGCGRNYSRAEHLARHQLNHAPKEIFKCGFPGCLRQFVRQDLCIRHRERHADQAMDSAGQNSSTILQSSRTSSIENGEPNQQPGTHRLSVTSPRSTSHQDKGTFPSSLSHGLRQRNAASDAAIENTELIQIPDSSSTQKPLFDESYGMSQQASAAIDRVNSIDLDCTFDSSDTTLNGNLYLDANTRNLTTNTAHRTSFPSQPQPTSLRSPSSYDHVVRPVEVARNLRQSDDLLSNPSSTSPAGASGNLAAWLFNNFTDSPNGVFGTTNENAMDITGFWDTVDAQVECEDSTLYMGTDNQLNFAQQVGGLPINSSLLPPSKTTLLSEDRRNFLIDLIEHGFGETGRFAIGISKDDILGHNRSSEDHVLSMRSMELFIGSYWYHFHTHLPILHKPTFSADTVHPYLLLAIMTIGASCLDKLHGPVFINNAAQMSNFVAWHLRWHIFSHMDCQPPAKLWVFQTLLLLEVFEKMTAKRALHERSHIHFATTLTLMRRGSSLVETTEASVPSSPLPQNESTDSMTRLPAAKLDEWWNKWIVAESTRRVAFAAFVIDSTHSTMFGHSANMVVHEICLPLPCDETLWSATSSAEVGRTESILHANGIKPITLLDGLKKILSRRKVRTNSFGRMIIMAGLLSVAWHMRQHDLQKSLFALKTPSSAAMDGLHDAMANAFDFWKRDFDESLAHMRNIPHWQRSDTSGVNEDLISEAAGSVLHFLSHISMHINIKDCQIFAGAKRLLGRTVTKIDLATVQNKVRLWAPTKGARVAVYHAVKYIQYVMFPQNDMDKYPTYTAQDDPLFNRPWVLYYAALVIWCYGYSLEGPIRPFPPDLAQAIDHDHTSPGNSVFLADAQSYLLSMGAVQKSEQLDQIRTGRNKVIGLLALIRKAFQGSKWELLHEASARLKWAIDLLRSE